MTACNPRVLYAIIYCNESKIKKILLNVILLSIFYNILNVFVRLVLLYELVIYLDCLMKTIQMVLHIYLYETYN